MKRFGILAAMAALLLVPASLRAQSDSSQGGLAGAQGAHQSLAAAGRNATVHGHANNPLGQPYVNANVFATTDGSPSSQVARFTTDANGDYSGTVPAGSYIFVLQEQNPKDPKKELDDSGEMKLEEKQDVTVNFDGTREAYVKKMSPEEQKAIAETKAKNAAILAENSKIKSLNSTLQQEREDRKAGKLDEATQLATQITQGKPEEAIGWYELGKDQEMQKKFDDAIPNLQKALQLNAASKKPDPIITGAVNAALGDAYANAKKYDQAVQAYDAAGAADPGGAGVYYTNEAIVLTAAGEVDKAAAAADKAIAADPTKPIPYFLKGQALIQKAGVDKAGKVTVPPGCVEAYQKYLELDPSGPHAQEVEQILDGIGVKVVSKYKAKK
jgi:tetratricopeptide (TPR) repeat protein